MEASHLQKSMKTAMSKCIQESIEEDRPWRLKKVDWFALVPDEIVKDILGRLSTRTLRYRGKYVCRRWFNIIQHQILVDHASFIIQRSSGYHKARQVTVREIQEKLEFELKGLQIGRFPFTVSGRIKSWCNENLLIAEPNGIESLYAYDLYDEMGMHLPKCCTSCRGHYTSKCGISLCYDGYLRQYKVIHMFMGPPIQCHILVLGRKVVSCLSSCSQWKTIEVPSNMGKGRYNWGDPVSVKGRYLHWDVHSTRHLVSMDTMKERFYQTRLPGRARSSDGRMKDLYSFAEMNGFLALLDQVSVQKADIWILKMSFNKMKWEKFHSLVLSDPWYRNLYPYTDIPFPICSVVNKRHIIFKKPAPPNTLTSLLHYDLKTNLVEIINLVESVRSPSNIRIGSDDRYVVQSFVPSFSC
ncbi:uncharacterized protein LOC143606239 [Bidens hawaiensis]|uniref:uncharacterized protein LOC143606239 n=1 Tax=Bidens hawaiensis TaxID=980011 RepID=UPI0040497070